MAQTANDILKQILGVCVQINKKLDNKDYGKSDDGTGTMSGMFSNKKKNKDIEDGAKALKDIIGSITAFNRLKVNPKNIDKTSKAIKGLFDTMIYIGRKRKPISNAVSLFNSMVKGLTAMTKFAKAMSVLMMSVGASLLAIAGSIYLAGKLLKTKNAVETTLAIVGVLIGITGAMVLLGKADKWVNNGVRAAKGMGTSMMFLSGGLFLLTMTIASIGKILGTGGGAKGMIYGVLGMLGIIAVSATTFGILGKFAQPIIKGAVTASIMGIGMAALSFGLIKFANAAKTITDLSGEPGKRDKSTQFGQMMANIGPGLGIMGIMIVSSSLLFAGIGMFAAPIVLGAVTTIGMSLALVAISGALVKTAKAGQIITGLGSANVGTEKQGKFGKMMSEVGPGLGLMGMMLVTSGLLFAGLGLLIAPILLGAGSVVAIAGSLILFSKATVNVMKAAESIKGKDVKATISNMTGGVLSGLIEGVSGALSGGEKGVKGFVNGVKNTAILMNGIGILMGVSVALSMFAKALTAFASLDNMRVIQSYDPKTGEPKFGETVNIKGVGSTITTTIGEFLSGLLESTEGLTKRKAKAIKKMGRALTGRRGILTAVIQFADVLKTFAQFGPEGKIGYVDMVPNGTDEDGNAIFKQVSKTVLISEVTSNITSSFSQFAEGLAEGVDGVGRRQKNNMLRLAEVLMGKKRSKIGGWFMSDKPGLLEPINAFSDTLMIYAKMGENGGIPVLDKDGNPTGAFKPMSEIVGNIVRAISSFSTQLSLKLDDDPKGAKEAGKKLEKYESMLKQLSSLSMAAEGLDKTASSINLLAISMGALATSLDRLDSSKLESISNMNVRKLKALANMNGGRVASPTIQGSESKFGDGLNKSSESTPANTQTTEKIVTRETSSVPQTIKLDTSSLDSLKDMPDAVGRAVSAALRNGQFTFTFSTDKSGVLNFE